MHCSKKAAIVAAIFLGSSAQALRVRDAVPITHTLSHYAESDHELAALNFDVLFDEPDWSFDEATAPHDLEEFERHFLSLLQQGVETQTAQHQQAKSPEDLKNIPPFAASPQIAQAVASPAINHHEVASTSSMEDQISKEMTARGADAHAATAQQKQQQQQLQQQQQQQQQGTANANGAEAGKATVVVDPQEMERRLERAQVENSLDREENKELMRKMEMKSDQVDKLNKEVAQLRHELAVEKQKVHGEEEAFRKGLEDAKSKTDLAMGELEQKEMKLGELKRELDESKDHAATAAKHPTAGKARLGLKKGDDNGEVKAPTTDIPEAPSTTQDPAGGTVPGNHDENDTPAKELNGNKDAEKDAGPTPPLHHHEVDVFPKNGGAFAPFNVPAGTAENKAAQYTYPGELKHDLSKPPVYLHDGATISSVRLDASVNEQELPPSPPNLAAATPVAVGSPLAATALSHVELHKKEVPRVALPQQAPPQTGLSDQLENYMSSPPAPQAQAISPTTTQQNMPPTQLPQMAAQLQPQQLQAANGGSSVGFSSGIEAAMAQNLMTPSSGNNNAQQGAPQQQQQQVAYPMAGAAMNGPPMESD